MRDVFQINDFILSQHNHNRIQEMFKCIFLINDITQLERNIKQILHKMKLHQKLKYVKARKIP